MSSSPFTRGIVNAIVAGVLGRATTVIKTEVERAKEEIFGKLKALGVGVVFLLAALVEIGTGLGLLFLAGLIALTYIWPAWLVALVGGGGAIVVGLILLAIGKSKIKKNKDLRPDEAINNIKAVFGS